MQVCASELYACGITVEGSLRCWGASFWGDDKPGSYLQVSCGMHHTCAITKVCCRMGVWVCGWMCARQWLCGLELTRVGRIACVGGQQNTVRCWGAFVH